MEDNTIKKVLKRHRRFLCVICGYIYDERLGWPEDGIAPFTRWEDVAENWFCPECGASKEDFEMIEIEEEDEDLQGIRQNSLQTLN